MKDKLLKLQQEIGSIKKNSENPFFKSAYFDINQLIDTLKPKLNELKLVILQPLNIQDGKNVLQTIIQDTETKEEILSSVLLPDNLDPQKMGSAITYYRRYSLQSLLFLQAEDDDGNTAKPTPKKPASVISEVDKQKVKISKLLEDINPIMKKREDYEETCLRITGFELIEANYTDIINFLNK